MFDLTGKRAFVTGSARGIGKTAADALAAAGAKVLYHGATGSEHLKQAAAATSSPWVAGDLGSPEAVEKLCRDVLEILGGVDILVLNGSVQSYTGLDNFTMEEFQRQYQTNLASSFLLIRSFASGMTERRSGRIIGVSSINQLRPADRLGLYATTKAALANLIMTTAKKYAEYGVTANVIQPGVIATDRNREVLSDPAFTEKLLAGIPAKRLGCTDDCAGAIVFRASDAASYITGAEIPIAGGMQL